MPCLRQADINEMTFARIGLAIVPKYFCISITRRAVLSGVGFAFLMLYVAIWERSSFVILLEYLVVLCSSARILFMLKTFSIHQLS